MNTRMGRHALSFLNGSLEHPPSPGEPRLAGAGDVPRPTKMQDWLDGPVH